MLFDLSAQLYRLQPESHATVPEASKRQTVKLGHPLMSVNRTPGFFRAGLGLRSRTTRVESTLPRS